jgi:hypothetical protein
MMGKSHLLIAMVLVSAGVSMKTTPATPAKTASPPATVSTPVTAKTPSPPATASVSAEQEKSGLRGQVQNEAEVDEVVDEDVGGWGTPGNYDLERLWSAKYTPLETFDTTPFTTVPLNAATLEKLKFCRWGVSKTCMGMKGSIAEVKEARESFQKGNAWLLAKANSLKGTPLTGGVLKKVINEINQVVRDVTVDDAVKSEARKNPSAINGIVFPLDQIDAGLTKLTSTIADMITAKKNPVAVAAFAFQGLNTIHPYADGNGRTCVFFGDLILMIHGIAPPAWGMYSPVDPIPVCKKDFTGEPHPDIEVVAAVAKAVAMYQQRMADTLDIVKSPQAKHCSDKTFSVKDGPKPVDKVHYCEKKADCEPNVSKRSGKKINQHCCIRKNPSFTGNMMFVAPLINSCVAKKHASKCDFGEEAR